MGVGFVGGREGDMVSQVIHCSPLLLYLFRCCSCLQLELIKWFSQYIASTLSMGNVDSVNKWGAILI